MCNYTSDSGLHSKENEKGMDGRCDVLTLDSFLLIAPYIGRLSRHSSSIDMGRYEEDGAMLESRVSF
jgi:hypothetical protein